MKRTTVIETIIFLFAILFLYTGISKLMEYEELKGQLAESPVLASIAPVLAIGLPWIEFMVVLLLVVPRWRLKGFYVAAALMSTFTIYIIAILSFSDELPCSCGGVLAALSWPQHIVLNSVFIALAVLGIVLEKQLKTSQQKIWNIQHNE
jgi:uncharacterized membrane protein YphA (DoxX/SURF4 family)